MGQIDVMIDRQNDLTVCTARGKLTAPDLRQAMESYLSGTPTGRVLWDFTEADGSALTAAEIERLQRYLTKSPAASHKRKIALVVSRDLGFGLARMADTYRELSNNPSDYHISRDMADARAWLDLPAE